MSNAAMTAYNQWEQDRKLDPVTQVTVSNNPDGDGYMVASINGNGATLSKCLADTAETAFNLAEKKAAHHGVPVHDDTQLPHHLIIVGDDIVVDRHFDLHDAEQALNYYLGNGEDAYLADSGNYPITQVFGWSSAA